MRVCTLPPAAEIGRKLSGKRTGNGWLVPCPVPSHGRGRGDRNPSLGIADGDAGLLVRCHSGCDSHDILVELRRLFGRDGPSERPEPVRPVSSAPAVYWHLDQAPIETRRACDIWRRSIPLWDQAAAPAVDYLTGRGLPPPYPETLAFAELPHPETGEVLSTLIVARHCPTVGMIRGIQRIFLDPAGGKCREGTAKMSLGSIAGGRAELLGEFRPETLLIAEGVETTLSAAQIFICGTAWAMCGGFPAEIALRDWTRHVLIVADNDLAGTSERRARALGRWIVGTGRTCEVLRPREVGADANDLIREAA